MAVAKSYHALEQTCEPYEVSGKMYVKVRMKSGAEKQVRWYTDQEWAKLYPEDANKITEDKKKSPYWRSQKDVLGFEEGFLWLFKGDTYAHVDYFRSKGYYFAYRKWFGWTLGSTKEIPDDLPENLTPVKLPWELVGKDDEVLKSDVEVEVAVNSVLLDPTKSEFQGEVGDRIEVELTVKKRIAVEGNYGLSHIHLFTDANDNEYVWTTAAKTLQEGETYKLRGTISEHKLYKASKQTILKRCTIL